ncbi:MAG: DNA repair protein RecO [Sedimentisphaerales bacterium]|nr:DNA repair protein RecO [Sedimentisphaerales bacterium]
MLTNDQAICIRAIDYSETSQVATFFTRQTGKVTVIAKGAKRPRWPFGGPIEVFSCGKIVFSDSDRDKLATLVEFEPLAGIVDSSVLAGDIFVLNCCLFAAELVNVLTKDYDPHPGLFDSMLLFFRDASRRKVPKADQTIILVRLVLFQLELLREIGLYPVLEFCVNCRNPFSVRWPEVYFSNSAKGLICRDCQGPFPDKIRLTQQGAKCLADAKSLASAEDLTVKQVEDILIQYITDALGRPPKMAKYILNP